MLKRYTDSLTHFSLGALIAVVMLCFDTHSLIILSALWVFGLERENCQHERWRLDKWSGKTWTEAMSWTLGGVAALAYF